jgi:hypothetical protein
MLCSLISGDWVLSVVAAEVKKGVIQMFRRLSFIFITAFALASIQGCSSLADARADKGKGVSKTYDASFDDVWAAIPQVLKEVNLPLAGENKAEGYVLAQRGMTFFSAGENVAIFVERVGNVVRTRVEVVSKKAVATNIFAPSWDKDIFEKLDAKFKQAK